MDLDEVMFFDSAPDALPLYEAAAARIRAEFGDVRVKVCKTQISFANRRGFACVSLPIRRIKGRPGVYIVLSFGLNRRVAHPRIVESVEPYPNRWTHHVIIQAPDEIDDQIVEWLREAYEFSMSKR